jgi:hypothetical protein
MKRLISKILRSKPFDVEPPVLLDIGASGGLPRQWRLLAPYSVGLAFDADIRDFSVDGSNKRGWKKLYLLNQLVAATEADSVEFFLTASAHCSSTLKPDTDALAPWSFEHLFRLERSVRLPATTISAALAKTGLSRIDWFKCDSQGTDLRLFRSLPVETQHRVLAADFEPGIIDAYVGEDKLAQLMMYMDTLPFWVSAMCIKGSERVGDMSYDARSKLQRWLPRSFWKTSPGWCEITYLNKCDSDALSERDLLLAIVFSLIQRQYGFATDLARRGKRRFDNELFDATERAVGRRLQLGHLRIGWHVAKGLARRFS